MPCLVSCLSNSYGRFGARGAIENLRAAGLEFLELPIRTAGQESIFGDEPLVTTDSTDADLQAVDELLKKHDVQVCSCNITSGNPLDHSVVEVTKKKLLIASRFGVDLVVGGAGEADDDESREQLYRHLREIGDCAAELGITYCFETHPGLCVNHRGMLETMAALDHPHLKLNFDTANILYYNEHIQVEIALAKVCPHVRHMHLKDSRGEPGEWYFPALGRGGAVDFLQVYEIMRDCGFNGPFSLELEGIEGEGELPLEEYQQRVIDSVEQLRYCGFFD
ncbi:MAG: sugar phosphate isomerase/epimerase [Planctomycetes bacterium]|nr:sugar phosphate isomerase/epimerase [Planctomycetota bacterium]